MSFSRLLQCSFTLSLLSIVQTVPPDYCLAPLNRKDCGAPPQQVFSYYKPGSRCELETWRGCPTLNKFENEYLCSLHCIFRMRTPVIEVKRNPCDIPLNEEKCKTTSSLVYTHINGSCEAVEWSGCPSENKFINKSICEEVCQVPQLEAMFADLDTKPLEEINEILDNVIEEEAIATTEETETEPTEEITTEAATEAETEVATKADTEAATEAVTEATTEATTQAAIEGEPGSDSPEYVAGPPDAAGLDDMETS